MSTRHTAKGIDAPAEDLDRNIRDCVVTTAHFPCLGKAIVEVVY